MENPHIHKYLSSHFENETSILGKEQVQKIIDSKVNETEYKVFSSEKGRNIEFMGLITVVGVAVQIIDFSLRIIKEEHQKTISVDQNKAMIKQKIENYINTEKLIPENSNLDFESYNELIEDLLKNT